MAIWVKIGGFSFKSSYRESHITKGVKHITNCHFCSIFQVRVNSINRKPLEVVPHVDVAIKSYAISILTGSTFDGFIDCTYIVVTVKELMKIWKAFTNTDFPFEAPYNGGTHYSGAVHQHA